VGLVTGAPSPPPWTRTRAATVGDDAFVALAGAKLRLGAGNTRSAPIEVPGFEIMDHEVTVDEYRTGCPSPWWMPGCPDWGGVQTGQTGNHPAVRMTWEQADAWCAAHLWRLPTEVEWALAARGPAARTYPWGNKVAPGTTNYEFNILDGAPNDGFDRTAPVGSFPKGASPEGVRDLSGNVSEWTADCWIEDLRKRDSGGAYTGGDCSTRTARGGSWKDKLEHRTGLRRSHARPGLPNEKIGFRCVRSPAVSP